MPRFIILDGNTIRESREEEERKHPRKRRKQDEDEEDLNKLRKAAGVEVLVRDDHYYLDDPDARCILRAEYTLFKVHERLLTPSSLLKDLLDDRRAEGRETTDEDPLELFTGSPEELRALFWALYASPADLEGQPGDQEELDRLLSVAFISYQYYFGDLHCWSIEALRRAFDSGPLFADILSSALFSRAVEVAVICHARLLLDSVVARWSERVRKRTIPAVPAMLSADEHNVALLRGIAYYVHIQEILERNAETVVGQCGAMRFHADPKLSNVQVMRLLSGYMSLVSCWERLRQHPPALDRAEGCMPDAHRVCVYVWSERWYAGAISKRVLAHNSADLLWIMPTMHEILERDEELAEKVNPACRAVGLAALEKSANVLQDRLADHFSAVV